MRFGKRTAAVIGAAALGVAALGSVALATGHTPIGDDLDRPGSVTVDERSLPDDDAAERAALNALATVDATAAGAAAARSVGGGDVVITDLEDEDGYVVWEVLVRTGEGRLHEVLVDAGNARILGAELEDDD